MGSKKTRRTYKYLAALLVLIAAWTVWNGVVKAAAPPWTDVVPNPAAGDVLGDSTWNVMTESAIKSDPPYTLVTLNAPKSNTLMSFNAQKGSVRFFDGCYGSK